MQSLPSGGGRSEKEAKQKIRPYNFYSEGKGSTGHMINFVAIIMVPNNVNNVVHVFDVNGQNAASEENNHYNVVYCGYGLYIAMHV